MRCNMTYQELEDHLLFFSKAEDDYGKLKQKSYLSEYDSERMGFISGDLHETGEILRHAFQDTEEMYNNIMLFLQKNCPNSYNIIKTNLEMDPDKYATLYDLLIGVNIKREDDVYFPTKLTRTIRIYK